MKKSVIFVAIGAMALLMIAAFAWDSLRFVASAGHRVALADAEMFKQEQRLVKLLSDSKAVTPQVQVAIAAHTDAGNPRARHEAYDELVGSFRQTMSSEVDPTNPLDRRFMDDIAGAINRREVAQQQYEAEWTAYQGALAGTRGGVARIFSSQARADWNPAD